MVKKVLCITLIIICSLFYFGNTYSQNIQKITITIEEESLSSKGEAFENAESLRKQMQFTDAITEYQKVLSQGEESGLESEACYNIGLCYTWLGLLDSAETAFENVKKLYPEDNLSFGRAEFGLAWVEIQREQYEEAMDRLQNALDDKICDDVELNAVMQFEIARVYIEFFGRF